MKFVPPQLATLSETVPAEGDWAFEVKYDGYRMQVHIDGKIRLLTRRGLDWTDRFPVLAKAFGAIKVSAVLDGEIVAPGDEARPFQRLQQALDAQDSGQLVFYAFDLLEYQGHDLRSLPWHARRKALKTLLARRKRGRIRLGEQLPGSPETLLTAACRLGLEGIICKRVDAPYRSGRNDSWLKVKCGRRQEFVIVGFTEPKGGRIGIGALLLGVHEKGVLRYAGRVGTGIPTAMLQLLRRRLEQRVRAASPMPNGPTLPADARWVSPTLVAEVAFTEWTEDGLLRHPSFLGLREDKTAREIIRESPKRARPRRALSRRVPS